MIATLGNWYVWVMTVSVVILCTPFVALIHAVTSPRDPGRYAAGRAFRLVAVTTLRLNPFWRFRVRGQAPANPRLPYVVVANHESYADVFLISMFPWEMKWLSKDTMFRIPCMGWMMQWAGDIKLTRGSKESAVQALAACRDRLQKKVSVMIFPEGTRSRDGAMLPFKDGAFRLAIKEKVPILPIAVAGTRHAMAKGTFQFRPSRAIAEVLEPVDTAGYTLKDVAALRELVRARIDAARRGLARELGLPEPPPLEVGDTPRAVATTAEPVATSAEPVGGEPERADTARIDGATGDTLRERAPNADTSTAALPATPRA